MMTLVVSSDFKAATKHLLKKYPSLKTELAEFGRSLLENPTQGKPLGRDCYKIRLAIRSKGTGKLGGGRVITCVKVTAETVTLLTIYDKSEQEDIPDKALTKLLKNNDLL